MMNKLMIGGAAVVFAAMAGLYAQYLHTKSQLRDALLYSDSLEAVADTTRLVVLELGDSLVAYERRAVQTEQVADSIDDALGRERRARVRLEARIRELQTTATGTTVVHDDTITASFSVTDPPYHAEARVSVPPPPAAPTLDLGVTLDPAPVDIRLGCGPAERGLRPATVAVLPPPWLSIELTEVSQDPDVCQSPILQAPRSIWQVRIPAWAAALLTLGGFAVGLTVG